MYVLGRINTMYAKYIHSQVFGFIKLFNHISNVIEIENFSYIFSYINTQSFKHITMNKHTHIEGRSEINADHSLYCLTKSELIFLIWQ